jgi:hypothetical protein
MQTQSPAKPREAAPAIGVDELAEGLMLVRASTLKMIRLQLAMERGDRRVAIEAVDDLVALDRRLQNYLDDVPAAAEQMMFRRELEVERGALNREKLTLAAEVIHGSAGSEPLVAVEEATPIAAEAPVVDSWEDFVFEEEQPPRRITWWLVAVFILFSVVAGAAYLLSSPEMLARLAALTGAAS